MYVLNAGPSIWSAFHVIGTVFDRTVVEGTVGHDAQTINLAPSQGGWVEFTLDEEGTYPFVTHAFGDMVKGALGVLQTPNAPKGGGGHDMGGRRRGGRTSTARAPRAAADVNVTLGDMWVKADKADDRGRQGHLRRQERGRDDARHGDGAARRSTRPAGCSTRRACSPRARSSAAGETETITADLKPGAYELVCFLPGHYAAGQKLPFEVR